MSRTKSSLILALFVATAVILAVVLLRGIGDDGKLSVNNIKQGLDLSGGVHILYEAAQDEVTDEEMNSAISLLRGRLDRKNWTEAEVGRDGIKRISVDIPGVDDVDTVIDELGKTAQLLFADESGNVILTGDHVKNATREVGAITSGGVSEPYVSLEFDEEGTKLFAEATQSNIGKRIAILLDDEILMAPTVKSEITDGNCIISGNFTNEKAGELAELIRAGALPFNLNIIEMNNVGARLGADALSTGIFAGIIGIILVLIYMFIMYTALGLVADFALVFYIEIVLLILSGAGVTLTLSGIAGIILSVGMAVDANVIIYERLKEELIAGKTLRTSIDAGFKKAFPAILDGNVTTLIAGGVLYFMGAGTVRGFAQTLIIGIIVSMFSALVISRIIVKLLVGIGLNNPKFFGIKQMLGGTLNGHN
ncbi:MAG: protein translocase subunit SecD [Lachnospiraceae bacterium]|nr:protein translocase subunit SecD [Lachnospiraceae bacterium]